MWVWNDKSAKIEGTKKTKEDDEEIEKGGVALPSQRQKLA